MSWSMLLQMGSGTGGPTFAFIGPFVGLLVMGAFIYVLWRLLKTSSSSSSTEQTDDAIETLRKRYARGEIDEEEFEEQSRILRER